MSLAHVVGLLKKGESPINANVTMALSSTTTVVIPTHAVGDYIVMFTYRDGNNNTPTLPAGWTALSPTGLVGVNSNTGLLAYKIAASAGETSGTWTNATGLVVAVIKQAGAGPLGLGNDSNITYGAGPTGGDIPYTGLTLANNDNHSVILAFGGQRDTGGNFGSAVSGMTIGVSGAGSSCIIGGHYTTTGASSFSTRNVNIGSGSFGYATATVEITGAA